MKQLALAVLLLTTPFAKGQEVVFGDTAVIRDIQGKLNHLQHPGQNRFSVDPDPVTKECEQRLEPCGIFQ